MSRVEPLLTLGGAQNRAPTFSILCFTNIPAAAYEGLRPQQTQVNSTSGALTIHSLEYSKFTKINF